MKRLVKNKYWNMVEDYNLDKLLYLLIDRPDHINELKDFLWKNNKDKWHRGYDLPSSMWLNGHLIWINNYKRERRNNKPAVLEPSGVKRYYKNGYFIKKEG